MSCLKSMLSGAPLVCKACASRYSCPVIMQRIDEMFLIAIADIPNSNPYCLLFEHYVLGLLN